MMRVRRASDHRLTIHTRSLTAWFLAAVFVATAVGLWLYQGELTCDRATGWCTIGSRDLPGLAQRTLPLDGITGAEVVVRGTENETRLSSVVMHTEEGPVRLGHGASSLHAFNQRSAERINAFLRDEDSTSLTVRSALGLTSPAFLAIALLLIGFGGGRDTAVLDTEANRYLIRRKRLLRTVLREGDLRHVTGTLEHHTDSAGSRRSQLGLLDVEATFHPLARRGGASSARTRKVAREICAFLGLEPTNALNSWDLGPSVGEVARSLRGVETHAAEVDELRARLEAEPRDVEGLRQLALRLVRLERRAEAGAILRSAHRHLLDQGLRDEANQVAGILHTLRI